MLLDEGRVDEAAARFNEIVSTEGPDAGWGRIGLAKTLLQRGRADQAVAQLEPVVRAQPSFGEAQYLIGTAYRSLKRPDLASRHLALGVRESAVPMPDPWSNRLQTEGRTIGARISLAQALRDAGRLAEAISMLEAARTGHSDDLELLSNLGAMYLDAGQPERAREVLLRAEKVNAGHVPTVYNLVAAELRLKDLDGALAHSGKALELAPTQAHSYLTRADVFTAMDRYAEAVAALREAIRLDPRDGNLRFRAGMLLGRLEKFQEAKSELDVATQIEPSHFEAWVLLCEACIRLKLGHEAQVALEQASRLRPDTKELDGLRQRVRALGGG